MLNRSDILTYAHTIDVIAPLTIKHARKLAHSFVASVTPHKFLVDMGFLRRVGEMLHRTTMTLAQLRERLQI